MPTEQALLSITTVTKELLPEVLVRLEETRDSSSTGTRNDVAVAENLCENPAQHMYMLLPT